MNERSEDQFQEMEALLEEESGGFRSLQRGDVIEGTVMGSGRDGILVNIGSKFEGIIPPHEMRSLGSSGAERMPEGESVTVYVLAPETEDGQVLLSIDRARGEQGWRVLQKRMDEGETFTAEVTGHNKGGLLVNVEGVNAFVPLSQLVGVRPPSDGEGERNLAENLGRELRLKVIELNRRRNRVILSERAALQEWRTQQKERLLSELEEGTIRTGKITSIRNFGVFVDLGGADGLAHLSELSWDRNRQPADLFEVGEEVDVYIMKVDAESKKIALSIRRAQPQQWEEIVDRYYVGQLVAGQVTKLVTFGAFARLDGPVEGLIHVSELTDRRIQHPREVVNEGDIVPLRVVRIERDRHRLGLSLRGARDESEREGWVFSVDGSVIRPPDVVIEQFGGLSPSQQAAGEVQTPALPGDGGMASEPPPTTAMAAALEAARRESAAEAASVTERDEPTTAMGAAMAAARAEAAGSSDEPEAAVAEQAATADEPEAAAVIEQAATADEPEAAVAEQAATADEPEAAVTEQAATADEPEAAATEQTATADEPEAAAVTDETATTGEPDAAAAATTLDEPAAEEPRAAGTADDPAETGDTPPPA